MVWGYPVVNRGYVKVSDTLIWIGQYKVKDVAFNMGGFVRISELSKTKSQKALDEVEVV